MLQVKNQFLCFLLRQNLFKILCNFQIFPCSIKGEIPKNPLSELCEKRSNSNFHASGSYDIVFVLSVDLMSTLTFAKTVTQLEIRQ